MKKRFRFVRSNLPIRSFVYFLTDRDTRAQRFRSNANDFAMTTEDDSIHGHHSNTTRVLTDEERQCLYGTENQERQQVSTFKQNQFDKNAQKYWDQFYKRNTNNFFKDRHWTLREFQIEIHRPTKLFEVGCGVGNFLFPLLNELPNLFVYACDFSSTAIQLVRENSQYDPERIQSFVCDLTDENEIPIDENIIDLCSMIFVLSAIHPDKMSRVLNKIHRVRTKKTKTFRRISTPFGFF